MNLFMDMKIAAKLITGFVIVAIIAAVVGVVGILDMKAIDKSSTELYENMTVPISELSDISTQFQRSRVNVRDMLLTNDPLLVKDNSDKIAQRQADIAKDLESFNKTILSASMRGLYDDLVKKDAAYEQQIAKVSELAKQGKNAEAIALMSETGSTGIASRALQDAIANTIKAKLDDAKIKSDANTKATNSSTVIMIIVMLAGALIAIGLGVFLSSIISKPIKRLTEAANKLAVGDVDVDVSVKRKTKDELGSLLRSFEKMVENVRDQVNVTERIAAGDLSVTVNVKSDKDLLGKKLVEMQDTMKALLNETDKLIVATQEGKLDTRGNAKPFAGGWGTLIEGVNNLIDAFVGPINVTAEYVDRISKGDIPPKITDVYNGDFNEIKNNLNACIDGLGGLVEGNAILHKMSTNDLTKKVEGRYLGIYSEIAEGINVVRERVVHVIEILNDVALGDFKELNICKDIGKRSENDKLIPSLIGMMEIVKALANETEILSNAAINGKLDIRADVNKFEGEYKKVIDGVNKTLDAVIGPLNVAAEYVDRISKGDIPPKITDSYNGDFNEIKNNLNNCIDTMSGLLIETDKLIKATQEGKLDTRGNAKAFAGGWGTLVGGINNLIDTLVGHIDSMPSPVMLIDKDFNIVYMNKNGTDLLSTTQKQIIGTKCYDSYKTSDCRTSNCACAMAMQQGQRISRETDAHPHGMNLDILYTAIPLKDEKNQAIGAMELVVDQTAIMNASRVAEKQAKYQNKETSKLLANIENLAQGKLQCSTKIEPTDEDTKVIGEMFSDIYRNLEESLNAMSTYVIETAKVLTEMSKGNLNLDIKGDYKGDFVEIKSSVNLIIDSLNEVLSDMNNASGQVAAGARQVSDSAQALSQGSTEQASSIEQLTASMEEISTQTKLNATNATQANELALAAKEGAIKGNEQMQGMLKAMDDINESSGNISKIIKVIDEIAFQTNILALNAAVEAARAGQHGKGFAVVAEEVRNLAARSANAAKETTALIEGSIKKVEGGTKIASETAAALNQIVEGVTKATNLVGEIATASNEQALGINQVNQGIMQVSDVVQTNSATSEESAAASEELSSQAELLREQVSRFKLKKSTGPSYKGFEDLNPEVLRMLEDMSQKKKSSYSSMSQGYAEAAATSNKPKISLSDREFGKY